MMCSLKDLYKSYKVINILDINPLPIQDKRFQGKLQNIFNYIDKILTHMMYTHHMNYCKLGMEVDILYINLDMYMYLHCMTSYMCLGLQNNNTQSHKRCNCLAIHNNQNKLDHTINTHIPQEHIEGDTFQYKYVKEEILYYYLCYLGK